MGPCSPLLLKAVFEHTHTPVFWNIPGEGRGCKHILPLSAAGHQCPAEGQGAAAEGGLSATPRDKFLAGLSGALTQC